jgi:hypothetical protein
MLADGTQNGNLCKDCEDYIEELSPFTKEMVCFLSARMRIDDYWMSRNFQLDSINTAGPCLCREIMEFARLPCAQTTPSSHCHILLAKTSQTLQPVHDNHPQTERREVERPPQQPRGISSHTGSALHLKPKLRLGANQDLQPASEGSRVLDPPV